MLESLVLGGQCAGDQPFEAVYEKQLEIILDNRVRVESLGQVGCVAMSVNELKEVLEDRREGSVHQWLLR